MGRLNLRQKLIESHEKWRKIKANLAKKPSVSQQKVKMKATLAGCEPLASQNRWKIFPPALLGLLTRTMNNERIREYQWEQYT